MFETASLFPYPADRPSFSTHSGGYPITSHGVAYDSESGCTAAATPFFRRLVPEHQRLTSEVARLCRDGGPPEPASSQIRDPVTDVSVD